jgi:JAB1/Mov34/MPN/PAD-1 ubiquitin protease
MATTTPALLLEDAETQVIVHPLVLLSVLDHHTRRQEVDGRVIGTLLGRRDGNKVIIGKTLLSCS